MIEWRKWFRQVRVFLLFYCVSSTKKGVSIICAKNANNLHCYSRFSCIPQCRGRVLISRSLATKLPASILHPTRCSTQSRGWQAIPLITCSAIRIRNQSTVLHRCYSITDPGGMEGWVGPVGWLTVDVSHNQVPVRHRIGRVHQLRPAF